MTKKIVILKGKYYEFEDIDRLILDESKYYEVTDEEYEYLKLNLHRLNQYPDHLIMVDYVDKRGQVDLMDEIRAKIAEEKAKEEAVRKARDARKAKTKATELEKKKRQLEKLKKELGET